MKEYANIFLDKIKGSWDYFLNQEVLNPNWGNFFYWLIALSLFFWIWEIVLPWRKNQKIVRKDFWLDTFYMFFNVYLISFIGYAGISGVLVELFKDGLGLFGVKNLVAIKLETFPIWAHLLLYFILKDFIHWNIHRLLHKSARLWEFHKVHHSVKEMGFAAHLRFHWMEKAVYGTLEYVPLALIGFNLETAMTVYVFTLAMGHFNHSNITLPLGPLKYIFNNPQMHIWHHAKELPEGKYGVNFGLTLSIWDYIFKTDYIPHDGRDVELGFEDEDEFPDGFLGQVTHFGKK